LVGRSTAAEASEADRAGQGTVSAVKIDAGGVEAHQDAEGDQKGIRELCAGRCGVEGARLPSFFSRRSTSG